MALQDMAVHPMGLLVPLQGSASFQGISFRPQDCTSADTITSQGIVTSLIIYGFTDEADELPKPAPLVKRFLALSRDHVGW